MAWPRPSPPAVEEQNAAAAEISRSAQIAASGVDRMAKGIASAGQAASATGADAKKVLEASGSTAERSQLIQQAVRKFLDSGGVRGILGTVR